MNKFEKLGNVVGNNNRLFFGFRGVKRGNRRRGIGKNAYMLNEWKAE